MGARDIGHAPNQKAIPRVTSTRPRYIGLRVNLKGPDVTSLRFVVEVGLSSVPSRRNSTAPDTLRATPATIRATAKGTPGRSGIGGSPRRRLSAKAIST